MSIPFDICDFNNIYNSHYEYSLPKDILQTYLFGKAFDYKEFYTPEERQSLIEDTNQLWQQTLSSNPSKEKVAIITAGAPGSGKTTLVRQVLEKSALDGKPVAYACPDDTCIKNLKIYKDVMASTGDGIQAYTKARAGSNFAVHIEIANFIREGSAFAFGTTSSSPQTGKFFEFVKKNAYPIRLLHVSAPDDVRWESIKERDKTFIQTTEEDVRKKGVDVPQRINDTYFKYADQIEFYYRAGVKEDAKLAATWHRGETAPLKIVDSDLFEKIKTVHNKAIEHLNRPDLTWEATVEKTAQITTPVAVEQKD